MAHVNIAALGSPKWVLALADIRRGQVVLVNLGGALGREQEKVRPCLVVSNDRLNKNLSTLIVVPITSHGGTGRVGAHEIGLKAGEGELLQDCAAQPCQVRTIDRFQRVVEIWGTLSGDRVSEIVDLLGYVQSDA